VPFAIWGSYFFGDDGEELSPEWESWDCWDLAKGRNVEWIDIAPVSEVNQRTNTKSSRKDQPGRQCCKFLSGHRCSSREKEQQKHLEFDSHISTAILLLVANEVGWDGR